MSVLRGIGVLALALLMRGSAALPDEDYVRDLEDVESADSLAFAKAHRERAEAELGAVPGFPEIERRLIAIGGSKDRFHRPLFQNGKVRSLRTDEAHPRGLWRETTLAKYVKGEDVTWTTLIDVDALSQKEHIRWVFQRPDCLPPAYEKCLVRLSYGGTDATQKREFDVRTKEFVNDGFEAPGTASWKDENTLFISFHMKPADETSSGHSRTAREWVRGTSILDAKTVFSAEVSDNQGSCARHWGHGRGGVEAHDICRRAIDMDRFEEFFLENGTLTKIEKPDDAEITIDGDDVFLALRSGWLQYASGSLVTMKLAAFRAGDRRFTVLFEPTANITLESFTLTKSFLVVTLSHHVKDEVTVYRRPNDDGPWTRTPMPETAASVDVTALDFAGDDVVVDEQDFTVPRTLALQNLVTGARRVVQTEPTTWDAAQTETSQHFAASKDGTRVPYFEVGPKNRAAPGPTIIDVYGGFGTSQTPQYLAMTGPAWVEGGGTFVVANVRGGSEYGAEWHRAATSHGKQKTYDDLAAVAEDLLRRKVTTAKMLGVQGFSNGGLTTSVMLTQRPELFGAIVSRAPLTDMRRYHRLFNAAAYESEYGNPDDPADWASIRMWSPLQNIRPGMPYPPTFYISATEDDRAHPAHARKIVALLEGYGYSPLYYESAEGGHEGAGDFVLTAHIDAMIFSFFASRLGLR